MGLVIEILALPLAPVRGAAWVLEKVVQAAEQEYYDPTPVQEQLVELERARTAGKIDEEEFTHREEELLGRLEEIKAYQLRKSGSVGM